MLDDASTEVEWTLRARRTMANEWLDRLYGNRPGFVISAVGFDPFLKADGRYAYRAFRQYPLRWPDSRHLLMDLLWSQCAEHDVFAAVLLRDQPNRGRRTSAPLEGQWAWMDADSWTAEQQSRLSSFDTPVMTVHSGGGPGKRHQYVNLGSLMAGENVAYVSARLEVLLGTDTFGGNNKILRIPGTYNHKPRVRGGLRGRVVLETW